ncbi:hypothetical protein DM860_002935 [Cuscuta australis]|uniref:Uncharacterized protein n=1 Tax=Cuscuta australis TaxID=267555 RepID=A0A328D0X3_9ASTE|nr:hypothetical protein DM860_002935 [Cuscuta australis]
MAAMTVSVRWMTVTSNIIAESDGGVGNGVECDGGRVVMLSMSVKNKRATMLDFCRGGTSSQCGWSKPAAEIQVTMACDRDVVGHDDDDDKRP